MKPIFTSLSPNTEKDDIWLALRLILQPWKWKISINQQNQHKSAVQELEEEFRKYLGVKPACQSPEADRLVAGRYAFAFNSGRSAFLAVLDALGLKKNDEILLQAFTCNAVVNPIIWSELKPVFVDVKKETLNIDPGDLEKKITPKSRAMIVQHTFGLLADLDKILEICKKRNLILIEDCAHSLGAIYQGKKVGLPAEAQRAKVGTFGRASFFSFGRDKIISSVYGGMAVTNDDELSAKIRQFQEECKTPSYLWILQQLLHPVLTNFLVIPLYSFFGFGKWVLLALQKLKVLSKAVHKKEKQGRQPHYIPMEMPNALAILALNQFKKLERFISHQKEIARFYDRQLRGFRCVLPKQEQGRVYMRYPILIRNGNTDEILKKARKQKIFLDDGWRRTPIMPPDTDQKKMGYVLGACPVAEKVVKDILNLPAHINISKNDAERIIEFLKSSNF